MSMAGFISAGCKSLRALTIVKGFLKNLLIRLFCDIVGSLGGFLFRFTRLPDFLIPTCIDGVRAPLGTALAGADGLTIDLDEDRIGVRAGKDADGDPA